MPYHVPDNRRASISTELIPYIRQKMQDWDVDFSTAINTLLLDHKRAGLTITGGRVSTDEITAAPTTVTETDTTEQDFDSDTTISSLVNLLDHGVSPLRSAS
ncbi:hypothetical protein [Adonisia turfae]|uniref:Uncharacterized protein n=1 Tax=Adonisia turfae CCMR0081 TaxID=2292702 RepID=A0A6M0RXV6_9CYAN|nr:hypothetical protein [Adonisia turfae]NEZ61014.1 hypothetical protein [Adonisia turfae CCMR0081]